MPRIRNAVAGIALGGAVLFQPVHAALPPVEAPAQWVEHLAQLRTADAVQGDEARCNAHPDLPGNQWRPGAAQGRCSLLRAPAWTLDEIDGLLSTDKGVAQLERGFAALLDAHYRDQAQREQIFIAFTVFDASPRAGEVAQRWLKAAPKSPFAMVASGAHFGSAGWKARGTRYASKTSADQFERMSGYFDKAVPLYVQALEVEPRLSVACYKLNAIGRQSDPALQMSATAHCLDVDPDSYYVAWEQLISAQPKWGGSDDQMRHAVAYAAARTQRNPILGALLGEAAGYEPLMADNYGEVVDELAGAARMGPGASLLVAAGKGYWTNHDFWSAIAYYSQALRFRPDDADYRYGRAQLTGSMRYYEWARSDLEVALRLEPDNLRYQLAMGGVVEELETPAAARVYYERALHSELRPQAVERYCRTFLIPTVLEEGQACTRELVEEFPTSVSAWKYRAWALLERDPAGSAEAEKRAWALMYPPGTPVPVPQVISIPAAPTKPSSNSKK